MTAPIDITSIVPKKLKTIVGLVGSLLTFAVPFILSAEQYLPPQWTAVIGAVLALLTAFGIYKAPYAPEGTVLAPDVPEVHEAAKNAAATAVIPPPVGGWRNPWKQ